MEIEGISKPKLNVGLQSWQGNRSAKLPVPEKKFQPRQVMFSESWNASKT
jgi:hypothetical protein